MSQTSEIKENAKNYFCECCQYQTHKKYNFDKHLLTKKHARKMNGEESVSSEPKIKRTRKTNKCMSDMSTQTEDVESIISDITTDDTSEFESSVEVKCIEMSTQTDDIPSENEIELENKNATLEDEVYELKYEIERKNEEIENVTISISNKYEAQIDKLKEENEYKTIKIESLMETINNLRLNINELMDENEQIKRQTNDNVLPVKCENVISNTNIGKKTIQKIISNENDYLTEQNYNKLLEEIKLLENICLKYEDEIEKLKLKIVDKDIENNNNNEVKLTTTKKITKQPVNNNGENPMNIYKELCNSPKCNDKIMNHSIIDRCNGNVISTTKILKSVNMNDYSDKSTILYKTIFTNIIEEMKAKNIRFIKCVDRKRKIFKVFDGTEWKKYSDKEFDKFVINLMYHINSGMLNCMTNTLNLDESEFKKHYNITKEHYLDCDKGSKVQISMAIFNPMYDDDINYMKTIKSLCCDLFKIENNKKSNKKRSNRRYDSDNSDDSSDDESDEEYD
jgi:hypothetical protein